jgi:UDP-N-acetylmuramyl pentapeptide phosphotransferase/UDP-N-acetylglucosamine-1-phosphate transferase
MAELLFFLEACCISYILTGATLRFSLRRRLLDIPNDRSSHSIPKPRLGGIAITISFYAACATLLLAGFRPLASISILAGALGGGAIIALSGLLDDLRGLDARIKLAVQFGAAGVAVASGIVLREFGIPFIGSIDLGPLAAPATIVWIVAIINLYNFIDGIDGLAAGIGLIASTFLYFISGMTSAASLQGLYAALAGSSFGFLRFNFPPARIFMGDMGSTFIGYMFAILSVIAQGSGVSAFITILLLAGAIGDAVLTLIRRALKKEKLFSPHRTHYYQRLTSLGLSHKQVTLLEYLIAALLGVSAIFAFHRAWIFVTFLSVIWIGFFMWALAKIWSMEKGRHIIWGGRMLGVAFGDLAFIAASYVLSYYLRLNFKFPQAETASMLISLPIVIVIRTAVFYYYGLYRDVWRYTTFDDVIRIGKAVSVGSAIMVVSFALLFRFRAFPRSVFVVDWFVLTVFMAGSRIATRWFHELPSREEIAGDRVIIAGWGPLAELVLRQVVKSGVMRPIGYLDDRVEMTGRVVHGMKVLGPISKAEEIAKAQLADEILVLPSFVDRIHADARDRHADAHIRVRVVSDPSEIIAGAVAPPERPPCGGRSVLVAGNGSLVEAAQSIFSLAAHLTLVSNENRPLEGSISCGTFPRSRGRRYLGVLNERSVLCRIFETHTPELVFADFTISDANLENAREAYVRTIMLPLEKIATEIAHRSSARMVVFERWKHSAPDECTRAAEFVLLDVFSEDPSRCAIVRIAREPTQGEWCTLIADVVEWGGGVFSAVASNKADEKFALVVLKIKDYAPDGGSLMLRLMRTLDEGDVAATTEVLGEMTRLSPVMEHAS